MPAQNIRIRQLLESSGYPSNSSVGTITPSPGAFVNTASPGTFIFNADIVTLSYTIASLANNTGGSYSFGSAVLAGLLQPGARSPSSSQPGVPQQSAVKPLITTPDFQLQVISWVTNWGNATGMLATPTNVTITGKDNTAPTITYTGPLFAGGPSFNSFSVYLSASLYNFSGSTLTNHTVTATVQSILLVSTVLAAS